MAEIHKKIKVVVEAGLEIEWYDCLESTMSDWGMLRSLNTNDQCSNS
jgi:hypothetical protein